MNKQPEISIEELMAEKLGMIVLCEHCGKRLKRTSIARIGTWTHEETNNYWCEMKKIDGIPTLRLARAGTAMPRRTSLSDQYDMEPQ